MNHFPEMPQQPEQAADNAPFSDGLDAVFRPQKQHLRFTGNAGEYFKIWIVNLLLSVLTLSFYAPWAKVRRLRYFYGNTHLDGRHFDFTGIPGRILIGRIIALVLFVAFSVLSELDPLMALIAWGLIALLMPWLVRSTMRFRARNTKYGNARFHFSATMKHTYWVFFKCALATMLSFGLLYPLALYWFKSYQINHLQAGRLKMKMESSVGEFYGAVLVPYFIAMMAGLLMVLVFSVFSVNVFESEEISEAALAAFSVLGVAAYALMLGFFIPLTQGYLIRATWRKVPVGNSLISTELEPFRYAWIKFVNYLATVLSLGLLHPWAAVRLYRYQAESMSIVLNDNPADLANAAQDDPNVLGEEIADVFDFDISL
ncbi:MAG: YjgN family protein [Neisseria sp.]|nr:YjgN family protein [Neisseria sp.]